MLENFSDLTRTYAIAFEPADARNSVPHKYFLSARGVIIWKAPN